MSLVLEQQGNDALPLWLRFYSLAHCFHLSRARAHTRSLLRCLVRNVHVCCIDNAGVCYLCDI